MSFVQQFYNGQGIDNIVNAAGFDGTVQHDSETLLGSGGIVTCDLRVNSPSVKIINITNPITLNLPTLTPGKAGTAVIYFVQDNVGGHGVSTNANVRLNAGNFNTQPNSVTVGNLTWVGDGFVDLTLVSRTQ